MSELDGDKTIEQLFAELAEAENHLETVRVNAAATIKAAGEMETKAANQTKDALNLYNGAARRIEEAMGKIRAAAPHGTIWNLPEGSTP